MMMIWLPANGIGQGAQPIISYNYGAGNAARVRETVRKMFIAAFVYMRVYTSRRSSRRSIGLPR